MNGRKIRACLATVMSVLLMMGLQQASAGAQQPDAGDANPSDVSRGELLRQGGSSYPRLVRLQHNGEANGRILASMTTFKDNHGFAVIHQSTDDGKTWEPLSEIRDPRGENGKGMCCSTLYELPQKVGDMPAGTLLWAGTAGIGDDEDTRKTTMPIWRSNDQGKTWEFLSEMVVAPQGPGIWEPEFAVSPEGELIGYYSDDSDPNHDQKMSQVRSKDGINWTDATDFIKHDKFEVRPGMAGVRVLPDGTYVMTYEVCNLHEVHQCTVNMRTSKDGWNWGDPKDMGIVIKDNEGKFPTHTPTITLAPGPSPNGRIILGYQKLVHPQGGVAPGNGKTLMVNDDPSDLSTGWYKIPSPVQIDYSRGSACRNFSPTMIPTKDGKSIIHAATDYENYIPGICEAFVATGPIDQDQANNAQKQPKLKLDERKGR